jgi:hypothetical protein
LGTMHAERWKMNGLIMAHFDFDLMIHEIIT